MFNNNSKMSKIQNKHKIHIINTDELKEDWKCYTIYDSNNNIIASPYAFIRLSLGNNYLIAQYYNNNKPIDEFYMCTVGGSDGNAWENNYEIYQQLIKNKYDVYTWDQVITILKKSPRFHKKGIELVE